VRWCGASSGRQRILRSGARIVSEGREQHAYRDKMDGQALGHTTTCEKLQRDAVTKERRREAADTEKRTVLVSMLASAPCGARMEHRRGALSALRPGICAARGRGGRGYRRAATLPTPGRHRRRLHPVQRIRQLRFWISLLPSSRRMRNFDTSDAQRRLPAIATHKTSGTDEQ